MLKKPFRGGHPNLPPLRTGSLAFHFSFLFLVSNSNWSTSRITSVTIGTVALVFFGLLIARYVYLQIAKANAYRVSIDCFRFSPRSS